MRKQLLSWLFPAPTLQESSSSQGQQPIFLAQRVGRLLAIGILALLLLLQGWALLKFPYFTPASSVEETAYAYTGANNFITYGFWHSGFLQNYSNSPDPLDHPYVYNHYPPGPDILVALLLILSGGSYWFVNFAFALIFVIGVPFYLKFTEHILQKAGLTGASYTLPLLAPWSIVAIMSRFPSSPQLLFIFAPLVTLQHYYQTHRKRFYYLTLAVGFVSSLYLEYNVLISVLVCWILLYWTQIVPLKRKDLWAFSGILVLGVVLHLIQNLLFLGPEIFIKELWITISNRTTGIPSKEEVEEFYRSIFVVHHGARPTQLGILATQIWKNFDFPGRSFVLLSVPLLIGLVNFKRIAPSSEPSEMHGESQQGNFVYLGKVWFWIVGTVLLPTIAFPAYGQEFSLRSSGSNIYFLAIGAVIVLGYGIRAVLQTRDTPVSGQRPIQILGFSLIVLLILLSPVTEAIKTWGGLPSLIFLGGYTIALILGLTALLRPTLIRVAIQHPIQLVRISSLLISGPLVLAA
ncbi:MAG: hypothetical protein SFW36_17075, partial [Leptolyngbyaceae cyanobacterium bins.59]|nr:hypothetical protein [Leptolyngbyaceae cyanobacterium bins.59]